MLSCIFFILSQTCQDPNACNFNQQEAYCTFLDACGVCGGTATECCQDEYACNFNQQEACVYPGQYCDCNGQVTDFSRCNCQGQTLDACGVCGGTSTECPSSPPPPSPPSSLPSPPLQSQAIKDPHLTFANGAKADFRGKDKQLYNFLSAPNVNVNVRIENTDFKLRNVLVHGSFMTELHVKTPTLTASLYGSSIGERLSILVNGTCKGKPYKFGVHRSIRCNGSTTNEEAQLDTDYSTFVLKTKEWTVTASPKHVFSHIKGPKRRLDFKLYNHGQNILVHGLLGQSFVKNISSGKLDVYPQAGEFTTSAMAEGAIEGVASDYEVFNPFSTYFKFSMYDKVPIMSTSVVAATANVDTDL